MLESEAAAAQRLELTGEGLVWSSFVSTQHVAGTGWMNT